MIKWQHWWFNHGTRHLQERHAHKGHNSTFLAVHGFEVCWFQKSFCQHICIFKAWMHRGWVIERIWSISKYSGIHLQDIFVQDAWLTLCEYDDTWASYFWEVRCMWRQLLQWFFCCSSMQNAFSMFLYEEEINNCKDHKIAYVSRSLRDTLPSSQIHNSYLWSVCSYIHCSYFPRHIWNQLTTSLIQILWSSHTSIYLCMGHSLQ